MPVNMSEPGVLAARMVQWLLGLTCDGRVGALTSVAGWHADSRLVHWHQGQCTCRRG